MRKKDLQYANGKLAICELQKKVPMFKIGSVG